METGYGKQEKRGRVLDRTVVLDKTVEGGSGVRKALEFFQIFVVGRPVKKLQKDKTY